MKDEPTGDQRSHEGADVVPPERPSERNEEAEQVLRSQIDEVPEAGEVSEPIEGEVVEEGEIVDAAPHDYLEDLQRLQAEFANYKRRVTHQQAEQGDRAAEALVVKLLPVLDAGDLALAHGGGEDVAAVAGMLIDLLGKEGLDPVIAEPGTPFDPTVHDAVAHEEGDGEHPEVVEGLRAGYKWKGRLIRPAMVRVKG